MAAEKRLGVALFGTGRMGSIHFQHLLLNQRTSTKWLVEEDVVRATELTKRYGVDDKVQVAHVKDLAQTLNDKQVDVVLISTPSFTHETIVKAAIAAGKAVFCEKPLAPTLEAVKECYDLAKEKGVILMCGFNRRYDPQCRKIYGEIQSGALGKVRSVSSISRDPPSMMTKQYLLSSGGIFIDSAIHDIDMVCWLVGEFPCSAYAIGHAGTDVYAECNDVSTCAILLKFPSGAVGNIEVSRDAHVGYDQRVEVLGEKGMVQSQNKKFGEFVKFSLDGALEEPILDTAFLRYGDSYKGEINHFLDAVQGKSTLEVNRGSTVMANKVALACIESLKTGNVVKLNSG